MLCPGIHVCFHFQCLRNVCRNYLETLLDLPWSSSTTDSLDLDTARLTLDADHYGLKPVC